MSMAAKMTNRRFLLGAFRRLLFLASAAIFILHSCSGITGESSHPVQSLSLGLKSTSIYRRATAIPLMDVFEVSAPVTVPANSQCQATLMTYSFANSYGKPFVGPYTPPTCDFNRVVLNFTVTSAGRQFDRLAIMYLNDTEVWRTSTAEPTQTGIVWTYSKDVSNYLALFKQPQKIIFDLGNIIDQTYTAPFNTTLTATFFTTSEVLSPADVILPISAQRSASDLPSAFQVPQTNATSTFTIPRNAKKAIFTVSACGQMDEEFWWSNVLQSDINTFSNDTLLGYSPFREVQVLVDGQLAGVSWPFPVIFTGGVVPGFWRPIVGIDAFDLREDEIDVTPWLPTLSDGREHTYEIRVVGITDDGKGNGELTTVGNYWVVSGKLFLWLDEDSAVTTGSPLTSMIPEPSLFLASRVGSLPNGTNSTLNYQVLAQRQLSLSSTVITSEGTHPASWMQTLAYSNVGNISADGNNATNSQMTNGVAVSSSGFSRKFAYPLTVFDATQQDPVSKNLSIFATMDRGKMVQLLGGSVFPSPLDSFSTIGPQSFQGWSMSTRQNGTASYMSIPSQNRSISFGETEQEYTLDGLTAGTATYPDVPTVNGSQTLYTRHVLAVNGSVVVDSSPTAAGQTVVVPAEQSPDEVMSYAVPTNMRVMLGRGPPA